MAVTLFSSKVMVLSIKGGIITHAIDPIQFVSSYLIHNPREPLANEVKTQSCQATILNEGVVESDGLYSSLIEVSG